MNCDRHGGPYFMAIFNCARGYGKTRWLELMRQHPDRCPWCLREELP